MCRGEILWRGGGVHPVWSSNGEVRRGPRGLHDQMDEHKNTRIYSGSGRRTVIPYIQCELYCLKA
jgi:hypothetical protein